MSLTNLRTPTSSNRDYFWKLKLVLRASGISLRDGDSMIYKIYSFLIFVPLIFLYMVLSFKEILQSDKNDSNPLIMYFFGFVAGSSKAVYLLVNRIKLGKLMDKFGQEQLFLPNPKRGGDREEQLIGKCVKITNIQTYAYYILGYTTLCSAACYAIIIRIRSDDYHDWEFPFGSFAVLNITYSPKYEICLAYQTLTTLPLVGHFFGADLIITAMLAHISFQFQILQNYIGQILRISYEEMIMETRSGSALTVRTANMAMVTWKYLKRSLIQAVNYHLAIINIAEEVEALFKYLFLIIFLNTLTSLCYLLYHASRIPISDPQMLVAGLELLCGCAQTLLLCYWGEQLSFQSQEVGRAAFETNFPGTDLKFQKALAFIIRRSQTPVVVSAGNFVVIGLPVFLWINRTSYSAFMMLHRLQN